LIVIGKNTENNSLVQIDIQRILSGRMLLQANSGAGKSYALRKFAEITHGKVQQIILDLEGEFASLREKFDYILVGKEGDIPVNVRAADLLAKRLLELNTSAIIDLYELKHHERKRFVRLFLDSMINAPKSLWHPCLVILDEAHIFAPEREQSEALDAVKDLATRGRKRGFALVAATQRISKLSKDVVAELNTKLIGRCSLDVDMKRAAFELGFTDKKDILSLRTLPKGVFYAFGPGLTEQVTKVKVDPVVTTHPEAGKSYKQVSTAAPDKVQKVLAKLADLPEEAEAELKTTEDFKRKIFELKTEVRRAQKQAPLPDVDLHGKLRSMYEQGYNKAAREAKVDFGKQMQKYRQNLNEYISYTKSMMTKFGTISKILEQQANSNPPETLDIKFNIPASDSSAIKITPPMKITARPLVLNNAEDINLSGSETKVLTAILQCPENRGSKKRIALYCGYAVKGGAYMNILGKLRTGGFITYESSDVVATDQGRAAIPSYEPLPTDPDEIITFWTNKLGPSKGRLLKAIYQHSPITREMLAEDTGYAASGGAFSNMLGNLRTLGLIDYLADRQIGIAKEIFPEMVV